MDLGLKGKVAMITGGSYGLGKATALSMAVEGANIAICARGQERLERTAEEIAQRTGARVVAVRVDVKNPDEIERFVNETACTLGRLDILVNNAGDSAGSPLLEADDDIWQGDLDVKLFGALRCSRLAIPHMIEAGGGRIINVTSIGGKQPGAASGPSSVSRAAGIALTKAMSKEFAPQGILVNTVCIGLAKSGQYEREWEARRNAGSEQTLEELYAEAGTYVPIGRIGEAEEVADLITFLASERASFITGAAINVDGGESDVV